MLSYIVLCIFVILQFVVILLLVRSLKANKEMHKTLTENKILKEELICTTNQLTELNKLKDKLFRDVIHDMRSPMATMVSMMEVLEDDYSSDNREIIHEVKKQVKSTFIMVEDLLAWLNYQKDGLVHKDILQSVQETISVLNRNDVANDIRIMNNVEEVVTLFLDKRILEMVLQSLMNNIWKISNHSGLISIHTHPIGQKAMVTVRDTGIIIDLDKAKTLFGEAHIGYDRATVVEKGRRFGILIQNESSQFTEMERWMDSITKQDTTFYIDLSSDHEVNNE